MIEVVTAKIHVIKPIFLLSIFKKLYFLMICKTQYFTKDRNQKSICGSFTIKAVLTDQCEFAGLRTRPVRRTMTDDLSALYLVNDGDDSRWFA